jgi:DNA-binding XRE family transcriptional regulator
MNNALKEKTEHIYTNGETRVTATGPMAEEIASIAGRYIKAEPPKYPTNEDLAELRLSLGLNKKEMSEFYGVSPQIYGFKEMNPKDTRTQINDRDAVIYRYLCLFGIPPKAR